MKIFTGIFFLFLLLFASCQKEHTYGTLTDVDGNEYQTIQIGDQEWMAENLKVQRYRNGDPINILIADADWSSADSGAWSVYENDAVNDAAYGKLYNGYAVKDSRGLCPLGWHIPTDNDWKALEIYLGLSPNDAELTGIDRGNGIGLGHILQSEEDHYWVNADNSSGFGAFSSGYRGSSGTFYNLHLGAAFWSSTESIADTLFFRSLIINSAGVYRGEGEVLYGFSCRCLKD
jgi:uncharacterized protein (TIGR02145 family)